MLVALYLGLVLLPLIKDIIIHKYYSKKYTLVALGSSKLKVVLILLIEVITLYV